MHIEEHIKNDILERFNLLSKSVNPRLFKNEQAFYNFIDSPKCFDNNLLLKNIGLFNLDLITSSFSKNESQYNIISIFHMIASYYKEDYQHHICNFNTEIVNTKYGDFKKFSLTDKKIPSFYLDVRHPIFSFLKNSFYKYKSSRFSSTLDKFVDLNLIFIASTLSQNASWLSDPLLFLDLKKKAHNQEHFNINEYLSSGLLVRDNNAHNFFESNKDFFERFEKTTYESIKNILSSPSKDFIFPIINMFSLIKHGFYFFTKKNQYLTENEKNDIFKNSYYLFDGHILNREHCVFLQSLSFLIASLYSEDYLNKVSGTIHSPKSYFYSNEEKEEILLDFISNPIVKENLIEEINKLILNDNITSRLPYKNYITAKHLSHESLKFINTHFSELDKLIPFNEDAENIPSIIKKNPTYVLSKDYCLFDNKQAMIAFLSQSNDKVINYYFTNDIKHTIQLRDYFEKFNDFNDFLNDLFNNAFVEKKSPVSSSFLILKNNFLKLNNLIASKKDEIREYELNQKLYSIEDNSGKTKIKKKI